MENNGFNNTLSIIILFCASVLAVKYVAPAVSIYFPGSILALLVIGLIGGVAFSVGHKFTSYLFAILPIFSIELLQILRGLILSEGNFTSLLISLLMTIVWPIFALYILQFKDKSSIIKYSKWFLILVLVVFAITAYTTYQGNQVIPGASRAIGQDDRADEGMQALIRKMNIGQFGFVYSLTLILPLVVYWMKISKKGLVIGAVFLLLSFFSLIAAQYSTALLSASVSVILVFLSKRIKVRDLITYSLLGLVLVALFTPLVSSFFKFLSDNISDVSRNISARMNEISEFLANGGSAGAGTDIEERSGRTALSWSNFLESPLWGSTKQTGGHSYVFDMLSAYGLIGLAAMIISYRKIYKLFIEPYRHTYLYAYAFVAYALNIFQCFVNPYNVYFSNALLVPLMFVAFREQERKGMSISGK